MKASIESRWNFNQISPPMGEQQWLNESTLILWVGKVDRPLLLSSWGPGQKRNPGQDLYSNCPTTVGAEPKK